jgi:hypothetical protein
LFLTGYAWNGSYMNFTTLAYSSTGELVWTNRDHVGQARAIAVDTDGNVYVTGSIADLNNPYVSDYGTVKYVPGGAPIITRQPLSRTNVVGTIRTLDALHLASALHRNGVNTTSAISRELDSSRRTPRRSRQFDWRRRVHRTAREPSQRFATNSIRPKPSSQVASCACATPFGRHREAKMDILGDDYVRSCGVREVLPRSFSKESRNLPTKEASRS